MAVISLRGSADAGLVAGDVFATDATDELTLVAAATVAARAFLCREIDLVAVRGIQQPVRIHELLGTKAKASPRAVELAKVFAEGLAAYRACRWAEAAKAFTHLAQKYKDVPSRVFLARIRIFASRPPAKDWNGVSVLAAK